LGDDFWHVPAVAWFSRIAGQRIANPIATISPVAMMLECLITPPLLRGGRIHPGR
jgi:hypothetical protein